jgi:hypothetical protein
MYHQSFCASAFEFLTGWRPRRAATALSRNGIAAFKKIVFGAKLQLQQLPLCRTAPKTFGAKLVFFFAAVFLVKGKLGEML